MKSKKKDLREKKDVQEQLKKPYMTPRLTVHGTVEKITGNLGTLGADGPIGSRLA